MVLLVCWNRIPVRRREGQVKKMPEPNRPRVDHEFWSLRHLHLAVAIADKKPDATSDCPLTAFFFSSLKQRHNLKLFKARSATYYMHISRRDR